MTWIRFFIWCVMTHPFNGLTRSPLKLRHDWIYTIIRQGWGQFRNWNWNWYQFQFQFQELELQRNWIKGIGIGIGIDKEELKELIQFLFLIVNSFWFFTMFLAESLNQFDLKPFWKQLTRISLDRYIMLYDNLSIKWILHCSYGLHLWVTCHGFCTRKHDSKIFLSSNLTKKFSCKSKIVNSHFIHNEWKIMGVLFKIMLKQRWCWNIVWSTNPLWP